MSENIFISPFSFLVVCSSCRLQSAVGFQIGILYSEVQRSGMAASVGPGFQQGRWGGRREGLRWLAKVNTNTCWVKNGEICRESGMPVLAVGAFSARSCWSCPQSRCLRTVVIPTAWLILVAPTFLLYSQPSLYVSVLLVYGQSKSQLS